MSWEIKVWHEALAGEEVRLCIEAGTAVPDEVVASLAGSYWLEEIQLTGEEWEESDDFQVGPEDAGPRLQS